MRKYFVVLAVLAATAAVSCNKEIEDSVINPTFIPKVITAVVDDDITTKTSLDGTSVIWTSDDVISVFDAEGVNHSSTKTEVSNTGKDAQFEIGTLSVEDDVFMALYPYDENAVYDTDHYTVETTLPTVQHIVANSFGNGANVAVAEGLASKLKFKNVGSFLCLSIANDNVKSVKLSSNSAMTGNVVIDYMEGEPELIIDDTKVANDYVELQGEFAKGQNYYFVVAPGEYDGLTITMTDKDDRTATLINPTPLTVVRNENLFIGALPGIPEAKWIPEGDVITREDTEIDDGTTTYSDWTFSGTIAKYAGQSAGSNNSIQLRSKYNNSGIVTTVSGGSIAKVTVSWNENTTSGRILNVYGSSEAYQSASDLYDNTKSGALLGTIVYGETNSLSISSVYPYVGVRSADGAIYLNNIGFKWGSEEIQTKTSQILSFSDDNFEITIGDDFTPPTLSGAQTTVTYTSDNESVAQVNASTGSVQITGVGVATITATAVENDEYYSANISYKLEVKSKGGVYSLVESALSDWRGDYLIAFSDDIFMNGALEGGTSGVGSAQSSVAPGKNLSTDKKSVAASWGDQYYVTIEAIDESDLSKGYVIKSHSITTPYFYQTTNKNGMACTANKTTAASYPITINFVSSSDIQLKLGGSATGAILHYNNNAVASGGQMFRYYKDGGQSAVYLYRKVAL